MATSGAQAFLQMLADAGVRYIFGNPGTTELPLNDALVDEPRIRYILGLQEVPVMAMADGYAMASRTLGVVNLHISCGLGNAMGMLYNAFREGTPLLVTAGQQDRRLKFSRADSVRRHGRRRPALDQVGRRSRARGRLAVGAAPRDADGADAADRAGVFVAADRRANGRWPSLDLTPAAPLSHRVRPPLDALAPRRRKCLAAAKNPAILVGSRVTEADAVAELVAVAERLGAPVISEPGHTARPA